MLFPFALTFDVSPMRYRIQCDTYWPGVVCWPSSQHASVVDYSLLMTTVSLLRSGIMEWPIILRIIYTLIVRLTSFRFYLNSIYKYNCTSHSIHLFLFFTLFSRVCCTTLSILTLIRLRSHDEAFDGHHANISTIMRRLTPRSSRPSSMNHTSHRMTRDECALVERFTVSARNEKQTGIFLICLRVQNEMNWNRRALQLLAKSMGLSEIETNCCVERSKK